MLTTLKKIQYLLRDPISKSDINIKWNNEKIETASSIENNFNISNNLPILINFKKSIVDESFYNNLDLDKSLIEDRSQIKKKIKNFLTRSNLNSKKSIKIFKKNLNKNSKILVIGGGNIGSGLQELYQDSSIDLISTDIYPSDKINFISDCHNIPIKDESVDGVIIQAVLEHVRKKDFKDLAQEIKRILKKDGTSSHAIDLKDHLNYSLNNLRFTDKLWETEFFANSGFYTNRLSISDIIDVYKNIGFRINIMNKLTWDEIPLSRSKFAQQFKNRPLEDLLVSEFDLILKHKQ